ncbi:hypothetical protein [Niabella beijingensis]|uniref:hypothetical protein n=1 Tax=Niabella beijingensis TaxID=2872700 RepID=UPI001CBD1257|nr:hypothetical protein [Niabella beijingensis]MBZ4189512.1 hypothetical protein [Niabella beijingensis]
MSYFRKLLILFLGCCNTGVLPAQPDSYTLQVEGPAEASLITREHPGAAGNKNGFEGGTVLRNRNRFHLFVTEEVTGWVQTRTGYWKSRDGKHWQRSGTVQASAAAPSDPRYSIWSPMPVYNKNERRWNLFYVGYETNGTIHGRVFRAVSVQHGRKGLAGPFMDVRGTVIGVTDTVRNEWEGIQGTDSFYPFRAGKKWLAFYGSSDAASYWYVGLAQADSLEGKWTRIPGDPVFKNAENPIVISLKSGIYLCVYDDLTMLSNSNRIGYAWSADGLHWKSSYLEVPLTGSIINIRTPQSIIPAGDDTFWIYYTGNTSGRFDEVARIKVKLKKAGDPERLSWKARQK